MSNPKSKSPSVEPAAQPKSQGAQTANQIKHMVDRFLWWTLPDDFCPDGGISFKKIGGHSPIGTNLFTAAQAEAMVRHMLEGLPPSVEPAAQPNEQETGDADIADLVHHVRHEWTAEVAEANLRTLLTRPAAYCEGCGTAMHAEEIHCWSCFEDVSEDEKSQNGTGEPAAQRPPDANSRDHKE